MVEIHQTVEKIFKSNEDKLDAFECKDEFSDTQSFCDHYGFKIEDSCNAILLKSKKPDEFFAKPKAIAEEVFRVAHQDRSAWSFRVELRPFGEVW